VVLLGEGQHRRGQAGDQHEPQYPPLLIRLGQRHYHRSVEEEELEGSYEYAE
jgi:hypothetical protein